VEDRKRGSGIHYLLYFEWKLLFSSLSHLVSLPYHPLLQTANFISVIKLFRTKKRKTRDRKGDNERDVLKFLVVYILCIYIIYREIRRYLLMREILQEM